MALHTWDMNLFKQDDARLTEMGILYDVVGVPGAKLDPADVTAIVQRYPRLGFKRGLYEMLREDSKKEGYPHFFHVCTCIEVQPQLHRHVEAWDAIGVGLHA